MNKRVVCIGGASGFWGDSQVGACQLVATGMLDYLVFDYLAETTMAILAAARSKRAELGYAADFVDVVMPQVLPEIMRQGIKVIANAGGINPGGCAAALQIRAAAMGLEPRIAIVEGDDVSELIPELRDKGVTDMFTGIPLPSKVLSANAYLGALPIARALAEGADIVITGRGVDSAVTLGALMHAFDWSPGEYDRLAGGSLAGHIIECGCQATGGLFTDWQRVPDWAHIGYPIVSCEEDGTFELTKPAGTGGLIDRACVVEQMLYEIGDPGAYLLPDVTCDFRQVVVEQVDNERVRVSGARGYAPSDEYKVSATHLDGYRCAGTLALIGFDAADKARRTGEAILDRTSEILRDAGLPPYTRSKIELFGCGALYGEHANCTDSREVMLRVVVDHSDRSALELFSREIAPAGTSWAPGTTGPAAGRPSPSPLIKPFAFLIEKALLTPTVSLNGERFSVCVPVGRAVSHQAEAAPTIVAWTDPVGEAFVDVPLIKLAWARSGDKGDISNIGLIARNRELFPLLWARLTPTVIEDWFRHLGTRRVERHALPGTDSLNLVLYGALAGGGPSSTRFDPLGKGNGQILLAMPIKVPASVAAQI